MRHLHWYRCGKRVSLLRPTVAAFCMLFLFGIGSTTRAQSGRRVAKRPPVSTSPATETKPASTPATARAEQPQITLYVCMDQRDPFFSTPLYLSQNIRNIFVQRLEEASSIKVMTGVNSNRSEAVKRAKNERGTYVVLLQLDSDSVQRSSTSNPDYSSLYIRFAVFAPVTGKTQLEGRVYQEQYRVGRGGVGLPSPQRNNSIYSDYLLKEAAREAANRVLQSFRYQTPRDPGLVSK